MNSLLRPRTWVPVLGLAAGLLGIASPASAQVFSIADTATAETGNAVFTVSGTVPAMSAGGSVTFNTADGVGPAAAVDAGVSSTGGNDYNGVAGLVIPIPANPGGAPVPFSVPVNVPINTDNAFELDETFFGNLSNITGAGFSIGDGEGVATIINDDTPPTISIADVAPAAEGNAAALPRQFAVTLSNASYQQITVDFATIDQTASAAAANSDYVAQNGTVTFAPFDTAEVINVLVNGDTLFELDETFLVQLTNPTNATIADGQGVTTIVNDDTAPSFSIADAVVCEEDLTVTLTITLSAPSGVDTTVDVLTLDGSATAPSDYTVTTVNDLSFPKGTVTRTVTVPIVDDGTLEPNETFFVDLAGVLPGGAATIADGSATVTVQDNDGVNNIVLENIGTDGTVIDGDGGPVQRFRATAFNGCGDPVPGVPLTFTVNGATGSDQQVTIITDEDGEAIFEYTPLFPGQDTITVSDEIGNVAASVSVDVTITIAPNTVFGQAAGTGNVDVAGSIGFFSFDVNTNRNGKAKGSVQATVPNLVGNIRSTKILGLVIGEPVSGGRSAVIFGIGKAKGVPGTFTFRVDALDNGTPGVGSDRFVVTVLTGGGTVSAGGVLKFDRKGIKNDIRVRTP